MLIEKLLSDRFYEILNQHGNTLWALETLEWEVFDKSYNELQQLNDMDKTDVYHFMDAMRKIYG